MSLASYLLKYLFIHRTCRVPWGEIRLSRTEAPHGRPCYFPGSVSGMGSGWDGCGGRRQGEGEGEGLDGGSEGGSGGVEFNVSHQGSLVVLAGTGFELPSSSSSSSSGGQQHQRHQQWQKPQIGIDITCVDELDPRGNRKHADLTTLSSVIEFVDIFAEVFSVWELETIKHRARRGRQSQCQRQRGNQGEKEKEKEMQKKNGDGDENENEYEKEEDAIESTLRLFYTYWALKEAYIKMTGEALLAPWLRELEFRNVQAPEKGRIRRRRASHDDDDGDGDEWGTPYTATEIWLYGKRVQDVRIEVVGFEEDYLVATAARGGNVGVGSGGTGGEGRREPLDPWLKFEKVDIERDVAGCATGQCWC